MQLRDRLRAGTASFAHLAGLARPSAVASAALAADENDDEKKEREDNEREANKKATGHAETDDERCTREAEEKERDEQAADDDGADDSDKEEMRGTSSVARARSRERARCAAIFMSRHAAGNPAMAAELAFNTSLSRDEAIAVLAAAPAGGGARVGRVERNPQLGPGGEPGPSSSQAIAAGWDRAFAKVTGARRS